jgi:multidrug efflux pump subunit AcrA (membrane-fusion protein)
MDKKKILMLIAGTLVVVLLVVAAFVVIRMMDPAKVAERKSKAAGADTETETVFPVNTYKVLDGRLVDFLDVNGDIISTGSVDVYPDTMGKIVHVYVKLGSRVTKGQLIAEIDPSRPGMTYANSPIRAPASGTITMINDNLGSMVSAQMPVAAIGNLTRLEIRSFIPERFISKVLLGQKALFNLEAYPGVDFDAVVDQVSPIVDPISRTMEVRLRITDPDNRIKAGMFSKVRITTEIKQKVVLVPSEAILTRFGEKQVYVVKDDTVEKRIIKVGLEVDEVSEIVSGLAAGEVIVYQGQTLLEDGSKVAVKRELHPIEPKE